MNQPDKYEIRENLYYDPATYLWIEDAGVFAVIGMSPLLQETSGSFVAIQVAPPGTMFRKNDTIATVEAEKHVGPVKAPVSGKIRKVNEAVLNNPRLINEHPYDEGWLAEIELANPYELNALITGEKNIREWFEAELKKFNDKGWIAQP